MSVSPHPRQTVVASLRRELARCEPHGPVPDEQPVSTGVPALDRFLPGGGLRRGTLVEYLAASGNCGAGTLALNAARAACGPARALVVVETLGQPASEPGDTMVLPSPRFYPPAAAAWGLDLSRLLVLRPASQADALWALDQALRCPGVGAVWARWNTFDPRDFRRLQLAAESGGTLGLLIRPARERGQPTWADVQWEVRAHSTLRRVGSAHQVRSVGPASSARTGPPHPSPELPPWTIEIELVRCRGSAGPRVIHLQLDVATSTWKEVSHDAPHPLPASAQLAHSTSARRA